MLHLETKVKIPFLWGKAAFKKKEWAQVNLIVGPNGSGKTLLAAELAKQFNQSGIPVRFLHSDPVEQDKMLSILKDDSCVREKIEVVLSGMFGKGIKFEKTPEGNFIPIVINKSQNVEYNLKEGECHGLKEILTLLVALYSTQKGCIIFDEPELHLHPQLQIFFINEIRKTAAADPKRIFFLITHSPFFIDLRFPEDLTGVVVCHINRVPTYIDNLSNADEALFRRFLPRFNTYHKQFFFSDNQIFVEGYTDQQMFSNLLDLTDNWYSSAGTGIIDVGGKDELGVFFKVCSLLGTEGRIICDLDALFQGKLRDMLCEDFRPTLWLEKQQDKQEGFYRKMFSVSAIKRGISLNDLITRMENYLIRIGNALCKIDEELPHNVAFLVDKICNLCDKYERVEDVDTFKTVVLQGLLSIGEEIEPFLSDQTAATIPLIKNLASLIFAAAEAARVYVLPKGCIEHYYTKNRIRYMPVPGKDRLFHTEREYISKTNSEILRKEYSELLSILERACSRHSV